MNSDLTPEQLFSVLRKGIDCGLLPYLICPGPLTLSIPIIDIKEYDNQGAAPFLDRGNLITVLIDNLGEPQWIVTTFDFIKIPHPDYVVVPHPTKPGLFGVRKPLPYNKPHETAQPQDYNWMNDHGIWGGMGCMKEFASRTEAFKYTAQRKPMQGFVYPG